MRSWGEKPATDEVHIEIGRGHSITFQLTLKGPNAEKSKYINILFERGVLRASGRCKDMEG